MHIACFAAALRGRTLVLLLVVSTAAGSLHMHVGRLARHITAECRVSPDCSRLGATGSVCLRPTTTARVAATEGRDRWSLMRSEYWRSHAPFVWLSSLVLFVCSVRRYGDVVVPIIVTRMARTRVSSVSVSWFVAASCSCAVHFHLGGGSPFCTSERKCRF